jgi:hypothetical protein
MTDSQFPKVDNCIKLNITPIRASKELDIIFDSPSFTQLEDGTYECNIMISSRNYKINSMKSEYIKE